MSCHATRDRVPGAVRIVVRRLRHGRTNLIGGLALVLAACGFSGEWVDDVPDPDVGASIAGRVLLGEGSTPGTPARAVEEAEPNDSHDTAQVLGEVRAGDVIVIEGHTTADDESDPHDGFRLVAPDRVEITATLAYASGGGRDFDLGVFDLVSLQFVETWIEAAAPEVGVFHAKGAFDLDVTAYAGQGDYVLTIRAGVPAAPVQEIEPNDAPTQGEFLGSFTAGDALRLTGTANDLLDETDGFLLAFPDAVTLNAVLDVPEDGDFDLVFLDATEGLGVPTPFAGFDAAATGPETGSVAVPGGTLLYVAVEVRAGRGTWTLDLRAEAATAAAHKVRWAAGGRIVPLVEERRRFRRSTSGALYGRPRHAFVPGQVLLGFEENDRAAPAARVLFEVPPGLDPEDQARWTLSRIASLRGRSGIRYAEPNYRLYALAEPDDTYYDYQWHYPLIRLDEAWEIAKGSASVIVAVIDTGQTEHPDLEGRQIGGYDFISDPWNARDGDGRDPNPTDEGDLLGSSGRSSFHGTHVAGTIGAATNNGQGVAGITWQTGIMHLRVLGRDGGTTEDVAAAILYAAGLPNASGALPDERAHVINMSLGGGGYSQTLQDAITAARNAGVVIVAAAGNDASSSPGYPAAHDGVLSVSAVDMNADLAWYSNVGPTIDLAAPGGDTSVDRNGDGYVDGVLSTMLDDSASPPDVVYTFYQGTSMAAPHVAGVAALVLGADPTLSVSEVESILLATASDRGPSGRDDYYGHGLVDAYAAVRAAQGGGGGAPILGVTPEALEFGSLLTDLDAQVTNVGGGYLEVLDVTVFTQDGLPWLDASATGGGDATRNVDALRVRVDRTGLAEGSYAGRVTITTRDGVHEGQVRVQMTVVDGILDAEIYVLAIDPETNETIQEVALDPRLGLEFTLRGLAPGSYYVAAGTDLDDDGYICDEGEWCGVYPVPGDPVEIRLDDGEFRTGIEFTVDAVSPLGGTTHVPQAILGR